MLKEKLMGSKLEFFTYANKRINNGRLEMNHNPLRCLVTRVMSYGKLDPLFLLCFFIASWRVNLLNVEYED